MQQLLFFYLKRLKKYSNIPNRRLLFVYSIGCHCDFCNTRRGKCAGLLLEAKVNVEAEDLKGETALIYAARNMFHKSAAAILEHGADISKK
jgi:hypothetical protein